ncbi:MAG: retropepsin-like aspartic protease [Candidatus Bathyarchaeia archaeon]
MRLTGWIANNEPLINAIFICEKLGIREPLTFCIDTGATTTCLSERDAIRLGINIRKLEKRTRPAIGIGGKADVYILKDVKLLFKGDTKGWEETFPEMDIIVPSKTAKPYMAGVMNLLGFDFLRKCTITFPGDQVHLYLPETNEPQNHKNMRKQKKHQSLKPNP